MEQDLEQVLAQAAEPVWFLYIHPSHRAIDQ